MALSMTLPSPCPPLPAGIRRAETPSSGHKPVGAAYAAVSVVIAMAPGIDPPTRGCSAAVCSAGEACVGRGVAVLISNTERVQRKPHGA